MMAWAFVPWKANELMPTCMAASCDMPVELRRPSQNDVPDFALCISIIVWMWLLTTLRCGMPCTTALETATVAWTSPVAPAPASVWPIQALAVLADKNDLLDGWSIRTALAAPSSIGSPSGVPVPCIWRLDTSPGRVPPNLSPARMTSDWLGPFGAVRDAELPSWLTAVLTMYAMISWSALLLLPWDRYSTEAASPRTYPSAVLSNVLHLPSGASMPAFWNMAVESGFRSRPMPAVMDATELPDQMALAATCDPTRDDEHAVSTLMA